MAIRGKAACISSDNETGARAQDGQLFMQHFSIKD